MVLAGELGPFDLAYLDPRTTSTYFTNYHVWRRWSRGTRPPTTRRLQAIDARDPTTKSVFNSKRHARRLATLLRAVECDPRLS